MIQPIIYSILPLLNALIFVSLLVWSRPWLTSTYVRGEIPRPDCL
jgi:hypothetical protein